MKKNIFKKITKDLTKPTHYTIRSSLIECIKKDAEKFNISESKVVNLILEEYYKK